MDDPALYHDELLEHAPALEQLSYYLTREEQSANDLVQETMITALERPPRHRENLGGWLHTVARNLALRGHRTRRRREHRENEAARPESSKAPDPAREEIMERVTRAVDELSEPYHTVIQLRFFEEMPPREIAARLDRPVKTVKSQLHRGLARLRVALEKEFGDDEEIWAASLLAILIPRPEKAPPIPALAAEKASVWNSMTWTLSAVAAALALVLIPIAFRPAPNAVEPLSRATSSAAAAPMSSSLAPTSPAEKQAMEGVALVTSAPQIPQKLQHIEARDSFGEALRGGLIEIYRGNGRFEPIGTTNAAGLLTFEVQDTDYQNPLDFHDDRPLPAALAEPSLALRLAAGKDHSSSLVHWVAKSSRATVVIETGRAPHVAHGTAIDEMGFPVEGVEVHCYKFDRPRFRSEEGHLVTLSPNQVTTDSQGRFEMDGLPDSLYWLIAKKSGFAPAYSRQSVFDAESTRVEFEMGPAGSLQGRITDERGLAIADAQLRLLRETGLEERTVTSDEDGNYLFEDLPANERLELVAVSKDRLQRVVTSLEAKEVRYLDFTLELPPTRLTLELIDSTGLPAANRSFEAIAKHSFTKQGDRIRKRRVSHHVTSDSEGRIEFPPQFALPDQINLFDLNEVGVKLTVPAATLRVSPAWASQSHATARVQLADLTQLATLRLRLVGERGRPLPQASIQARPLDGQRIIRCRRRPGDDGIWVRDAQPGRYALFAQLPTRGQAFVKEVNLRAGETMNAGDLALPGNATLLVDPTWWTSLPEVELRKGANTSVPVQFELHQLTDWSSANSSYSIFREEQPRVSYEVLPGRYALRRVHGRDILDEVLLDLERIDGKSVAQSD